MFEHDDKWWWGYKHINGSIIAKRWLSNTDISEAHESPFVQMVIHPFKASGREEALAVIKRKT